MKGTIHYILLALLIAFSSSLITLEWSRFFFFYRPVESYYFTTILKFLTSFLAGLLVWTTGNDNYTTDDSLHLKIAFLAIVLGDLFFFLQLGTLAIGIFALGQILLTLRNSKGIIPFFRDPKRKPQQHRACIALGLMAFCTALIVVMGYYQLLGKQTMFYFMVLYSIFLCISVWIAWISRFTGYFAPKNAVLITIGMVLFYACDVSVGFGIAMDINPAYQNTYLRMTVTSLTWVFYAPALILLALSGFNYEQR